MLFCAFFRDKRAEPHVRLYLDVPLLLCTTACTYKFNQAILPSSVLPQCSLTAAPSSSPSRSCMWSAPYRSAIETAASSALQPRKSRHPAYITPSLVSCKRLNRLSTRRDADSLFFKVDCILLESFPQRRHGS